VLTNDVNCTVLMLEYRGYGLSTGTPNEQGLVIDAQTGLDYIRSREDLKNNKIVIFGQSIGGAVAIDLVSKNQEAGDIKGLILENTFLSIAKMIPNAVPVAKWLTPFCHEYWRSEEMIPKITKVPILFLSGLQDEIVPYVVVFSLTYFERTQALRQQQTKPHEATLPPVQDQNRDVERAAVRRSQQHCRGNRVLQLHRRVYLATRGRYAVNVYCYIDSSFRMIPSRSSFHRVTKKYDDAHAYSSSSVKSLSTIRKIFLGADACR
jgi:hypothetical protein